MNSAWTIWANTLEIPSKDVMDRTELKWEEWAVKDKGTDGFHTYRHSALLTDEAIFDVDIQIVLQTC